MLGFLIRSAYSYDLYIEPLFLKARQELTMSLKHGVEFKYGTPVFFFPKGFLSACHASTDTVLPTNGNIKKSHLQNRMQLIKTHSATLSRDQSWALLSYFLDLGLLMEK